MAPGDHPDRIVHLLRNSFKYASKRDWAAIARDLKPVRTAASEAAALDAFAELSGVWEARYPAIVRLWENAWAEFVPFLAFDREAALEHLCLVIISMDPAGPGRQRWSNRWKAALNAFDITFDGRLSAGRK